METVRGPVDVDDLGTTLMHEHVFVLTPDMMQNYRDEYWDEEVRVADAITKLRRLRELGVTTIVDPHHPAHCQGATWTACVTGAAACWHQAQRKVARTPSSRWGRAARGRANSPRCAACHPTSIVSARARQARSATGDRYDPGHRVGRGVGRG